MLLAARVGEPMTTADVIFARVLMGLVLVEFFADQQQWSKCYSHAGQFIFVNDLGSRLPECKTVLPENSQSTIRI